jgi:hypothetical protein
LFGGAESMAWILLHAYWNGVFESLGASIGEERLEDIKNTLKKRLRNHSLGSDEDFGRLASVVARFSYEVRHPRMSVNLDQLKERHRPFLDEEKLNLERLLEQKDEAPTWLKHAENTLFDSIERMSMKGVLQQGYEWQCSQCFHVNWNGITNLRPELTCGACGKGRPAPVEQGWNFKLHGFVLQALKEHGLLPVVWALYRLHCKARESFYFVPGQEFLSGYPDDERTKRLGDADLLCVVDRMVYLVEAKSSVQGVNVEGLLTVAKKLRPNQVVLAIMETLSARIKKKFDELTNGLAGTGINAELMVTDAQTFERRAYLP